MLRSSGALFFLRRPVSVWIISFSACVGVCPRHASTGPFVRVKCESIKVG